VSTSIVKISFQAPDTIRIPARNSHNRARRAIAMAQRRIQVRPQKSGISPLFAGNGLAAKYGDDKDARAAGLTASLNPHGEEARKRRLWTMPWHRQVKP
jgi:hypothetical protein